MHALVKTSTLIVALLANQAQAHEGHGIAGASHWHATDTLGWIAAALAIAVGLWVSRK